MTYDLDGDVDLSSLMLYIAVVMHACEVSTYVSLSVLDSSCRARFYFRNTDYISLSAGLI
jgi:hypothetical protein